jgi:Squalene-hopene cyclase C-terminal domain/Prenyltransferase and squalene oxidase repeat
MTHPGYPAELRRGLQGATDFLLRSRSAAHGLWEDFRSTAGPSSEWVTGFVLANLPATAHAGAGEACRLLIERQRADGSWGYCARVPGDADSTAWAILGTRSALPPGRRSAARTYLLAQQRPDSGGFRTYPDSAASGLIPWAPADRDYRGWQAAHTCVSGTVLLALASLGGADAPAAAAVDYLVRRQDPSGVWPSYWWSGPAYSTHQAIRALRQRGQLTISMAARAVRELGRRQLPGGGWAWDGHVTGPAGAFETAFALLALHEARRAGAGVADDCLQRGLEWLLASQSGPGCWPAHAILRVPMPGDITERLGATETARRPGGLGADVNGIFTTAAVARCLATCQEELAGSVPRERGWPALVPPGRVAGQSADIPPVLRYLAVHEAQTAFVTTMSSFGLTIAPATRSAILDTDRGHGRRLAAQLPGPSSPSRLFGRTWRRQVVSMLGFGWGVADVLAAHQSLAGQPAAAELGALLVLGTAAVDRCCDGSTAQRDALLSVLNRDLIRAAASRDSGQRALANVLDTVSDPDVRYVVKLIMAFFRQLARCPLDASWYLLICELLLQAYEAELGTLTAAAPGRIERPAAGAHLAARVLPFEVISAIACGLGRHGCGARAERACARVPRLLGLAVATLDDLADLCPDASAGCVNSLLDSSPDSGQAGGLQGPAGALVRVLASGACWQAARQVAQAVAGLGEAMPPSPEPHPPAARQRILAHLWGWGDLGRPELDRWPPRPVSAAPPRDSRTPGHAPARG